MVDDEIKALRQVRHDISAEFGHDVDRVVDYYRRVEEELRQSGRYRFATHGAGHEPTDAREVARPNNVTGLITEQQTIPESAVVLSVSVRPVWSVPF